MFKHGFDIISTPLGFRVGKGGGDRVGWRGEITRSRTGQVHTVGQRKRSFYTCKQVLESLGQTLSETDVCVMVQLYSKEVQ